jgi:hypothetical protein
VSGLNCILLIFENVQDASSKHTPYKTMPGQHPALSVWVGVNAVPAVVKTIEPTPIESCNSSLVDFLGELVCDV